MNDFCSRPRRARPGTVLTDRRTGGLDVIRKDARSFHRTSSGVRLCWELEEPKGPTGFDFSRGVFWLRLVVGLFVVVINASLSFRGGRVRLVYRGTSPTRKRKPLGPCRRPMPMVVGGG